MYYKGARRHKMQTTGRNAKSASTRAAGLFATLRGLLHVSGSGAPKSSPGTGASKTGCGGGVVSVRRPGRTFHPFSRLKCCVPALLCAVVGLLAFTAAPALAASPEPPELRAEPTFATTASLDGVLNPHSTPSEAGTYQFSSRKQTVAGEDKCKGTGKKMAPAVPGAGDGLEHEELP